MIKSCKVYFHKIFLRSFVIFCLSPWESFAFGEGGFQRIPDFQIKVDLALTPVELGSARSASPDFLAMDQAFS